MNTNNEFLRITWEHVFQCYLLTLQYSVIMLFKVFFSPLVIVFLTSCGEQEEQRGMKLKTKLI